MKYLFNCLLLTVISFSSIFAQKLTTSSTYVKRTVNLKENIDHWKASVQSMQMTNPGGNSYNDFLIIQKQIQTQKYPRKKSLKSLYGSCVETIFWISFFSSISFPSTIPFKKRV